MRPTGRIFGGESGGERVLSPPVGAGTTTGGAPDHTGTDRNESAVVGGRVTP